MAGFAPPRPFWEDPNDAANWRALVNWLNSLWETVQDHETRITALEP